MANKQTMPGMTVPQRRNLVSGSINSAGFRNVYQMPDVSRPLQNAAAAAKIYYDGEKEAAFKRLDLLASRKQLEELEEIRVADSNEQVPEIENNFKMTLDKEFSSDNWGKKWLEERGDLFFAANSRDVFRAGIAKQKELYTLQMDKTLNTFAEDIATSAEDKARVLIGDAEKFIDESNLLSPEEKQKSKDNFMDLTLQRSISNNPTVALKMLGDSSFDWGAKGIDINKYQQAALASMKNANQKRLVAQINNNRDAAEKLINKSMAERLTLDEINRAVPEKSAELRTFLYGLNGYEKSDVENGGVKLTPEQKAVNAENLQIELAGLIGNPETSIEDWQKYENEVYRMMNNKSIDKSSGIGLLNNFATPFMESYQSKLKDDTGTQWRKIRGIPYWYDTFGYDGLENWIDRNVLPNKVKKADYKNDMAVYKKLEAGQARIRADIYQQYNTALIQAAKDAGLQNVAEIKTLTDSEQASIYRTAQETVQKNWSLQEFIRLRNMPPEKLPNAVLNKGELVNSSNNMDNAKKGTPVSDERYVGTAYDPETGKYALKRVDGTYEQVSYEKYKQYGGIK